MKTKRFFSIMAMLTLAVFTAVAQTKDEVTLTVSGDGATKEEATKNALRDAIGQAFGTFVSSNSQLLNDELVKDEVVSITSGNVKSYKEISSVVLQNRTIVTLQATVCISKLVSYAKSKGSSAELAGATFAMNMKIKELNKRNEYQAMRDLLVQLMLYGTLFDYKLDLGEPRVLTEDYYGVDATVHLLFTEKLKSFNDIIFRTLSSLSLSAQEQEEYKKVGLEMYKYSMRGPKFNASGESSDYGERVISRYQNRWNRWCDFFLRNDYRHGDDESILGLGITNKQLQGIHSSPFVSLYPSGVFGLIDFIMHKYVRNGFGIKNNLGTRTSVQHIETYIYNSGPWIYYQIADSRIPTHRLQSTDFYPTPICLHLSIGAEVARATFTIVIPKADIAKYSSFEVVPVKIDFFKNK